MTTDKKIALVTGAASGIGAAIARALAREVGAVVVVADRNREGATGVAEEIDGVPLQVDVARPSACRKLIRQVEREVGGVDILVNNAGFQHVDPIDRFPDEKWNALLAVLLTAPFLLIKAVWPGMKARGWGRIVNIASIHASVASPLKAGYVAAKHGLLGLTRVAALEGGEFGITVNAVCPAYVSTRLVEDQLESQARMRGISRQDVLEQVMLQPAAVKRLISPEEVADVVVYLCSDRAGSVTGAAWNIDLGWTAR